MTFMRISRQSSTPFFGVGTDSDIQVDYTEDYAEAGSFLSADIYIDVKKDLTSCELNLISTGLEELRVYSSFRLTCEKTRKVFVFKETVRFWKELRVGEYRVPVRLKIPSHCPASFYFSEEDSEKNYVKSSISYILTCSLKAQEREMHYDLHYTVKDRESSSQNLEKIEFVKSLKGCCCFSLGKSHFFLEFLEKNLVVNGGFTYKIATDNSGCSLGIAKIYSQVVRTVKCFNGLRDIIIKNVISKIQRAVDIPAKSNRFESLDFVFKHDIKMAGEDFNTSSARGGIIKCFFDLEVFVHYAGREKAEVFRVNLLVSPVPENNRKIVVPALFEEEPEITLLIE